MGMASSRRAGSLTMTLGNGTWRQPILSQAGELTQPLSVLYLVASHRSATPFKMPPPTNPSLSIKIQDIMYLSDFKLFYKSFIAVGGLYIDYSPREWSQTASNGFSQLTVNSISHA